MTWLRTTLVAVLASLVLAAGATAQEPIRFGRTPDISPDGRLVAFSYLGDIWVVDAIGGIARPVTMHEAHDAYPAFSPDGRWIAFSSNRHGSYDVFVVPTQGGKPRRLTYDSAADLVNGWSPDGKTVLFTSTRTANFPNASDLYAVPVEGGDVRRITRSEARDGVYAPQGERVAYVRGAGTWYRKGYRGSSNDDIWICNADGTANVQVTHFDGQDTSPMWSPDGQWLYYVSEIHGTPANIVRQPVTGKARPERLTDHSADAVRRARLSGNGEWIVYECGADLWILSTHGGAPRKLAIEVHADDKVNTERTVTLTQGASEFALSFNERHLAFVVHGEIFLMPIAGGKATRLTNSPANDHGIAWSPDSKKMVFASDRDGSEDLYLLEADDPDHKEFVDAHRFKAKRLTKTPEAEVGASFSPDGKRVAFLRAGKLWTMNPDGTDQKVVVNDLHVFDYEWSPDSKYFVYARRDGNFASDLYIIPSAGGEAKNVTRYATMNQGVTWSQRGKKLAFISERRRNEPSLYVLSLQKPAAPGAATSNDIDWDDIHLRVEQPLPLPVLEGAISADGLRLAFRAASQGGEDLWVASTDGSRLSRLTTGNQRPRQITWSRTSDTIYYLDLSGQIRTTRAGGGPSLPDFARLALGPPTADRIPFSARMTVRRDEDFQEMFEQSWRALAEEAYDPIFKGLDWTFVRLKYTPLVKHVAMKEDFYTLVSLMLGELNASHLGISGFATAPDETTAELGLVFDDTYKGPGLKVAEILKRGPADKRGIKLRPGEVILAVDGEELSGKVELSKLLNGKVNETIALTVAANPADSKDRRRVELQGASREAVRELMYQRWVDRNAQRVAELTKGRIGYIHIASMDEEGVDRFVRSLYSDNFDKDAIVLDVRYNGGGFTHDQILNYLGGRTHTFFRQRGGSQGDVMRSFDRKWTKPLVLLINNRSFSDAEIFPSAFKTLGLGKLVGQPTGAHVLGASPVPLIDGSRLRIPHVGVYNFAGKNMDREGVMPDIRVEQHPDELARGADPQLDRAVAVVQQDVLAWKASHPDGLPKLADTPAATGATATTVQKSRP